MKKITIESVKKALNTCFDCTQIKQTTAKGAKDVKCYGNPFTYERVKGDPKTSFNAGDFECIALFNPIEVRDLFGNYELRDVYITADDEEVTIWRYRELNEERGCFKQYSSFEFKDYDNQACLFVAITRDLMMLFD